MFRKVRDSESGLLLDDVPNSRHPNQGETTMKHRTNRTNFRTAAAVTLAALTFATTACGGSDEVIDSAPEAVDAEAPASDDAAEQVADTADDAPATEAPATAEEPAAAEPAAEPAPAQESTPASQPAAEPAEEPAAEAVETTVPPTTAPVAEDPVAEEPVAEEETEVVEETTTTVAEVVRQLLVDIEFSSTYGPINVEAELTGFVGGRYKGIESVCLVQYNEYGNPIPQGGAEPYTRLSAPAEIDGVRYPDLIANGCRPNNDNFGEYTTDWSVEATRGSNGNRKDYYDVAVRGEDGQVRVFCMDTDNFRNGFVERNMADYAGRTSMGPCPS